jgi:hypothetical protein
MFYQNLYKSPPNKSTIPVSNFIVPRSIGHKNWPDELTSLLYYDFRIPQTQFLQLRPTQASLRPPRATFPDRMPEWRTNKTGRKQKTTEIIANQRKNIENQRTCNKNQWTRIENKWEIKKHLLNSIWNRYKRIENKSQSTEHIWKVLKIITQLYTIMNNYKICTNKYAKRNERIEHESKTCLT